MKDKSYRAFPLGQDAGHYLRAKRKRLTVASYRDYESCLDKFARYFADLESPTSSRRSGQSGWRSFSTSSGARARTHLQQEPVDPPGLLQVPGASGRDCTATRRCRSSGRRSAGVHRSTFSVDDRSAILAAKARLRDQIALRLLLDYGLRKGALRGIQFKHFDHHRKRLTIFTKGGKVRDLPIPQPVFWFDLERLILEDEARAAALPPTATEGDPARRARRSSSSTDSLNSRWAYTACTTGGTAVSSAPGSSRRASRRGEQMHKARHTAGQRVLDVTGNLKAVQKLLGHESIQTTGDITRTGTSSSSPTRSSRRSWRASMESFPTACQESPANRAI